MTDLDLREAFESSFDTEPPLSALDPTLRAGRSALMRRRILTTGAALSVAAVALVGVSQLGHDSSASSGPVGEPDGSTVSQEDELTGQVPVDDGWRKDCDRTGRPRCTRYAATSAPLGLDADGTLVRTSSDVVVGQRLDDETPPTGTVRVVVEARTAETVHYRWYIVTRGSDGSVVRVGNPAESSVDFATFAEAVVADRPFVGGPPIQTLRVIAGR